MKKLKHWLEYNWDMIQLFSLLIALLVTMVMPIVWWWDHDTATLMQVIKANWGWHLGTFLSALIINILE